MTEGTATDTVVLIHGLWLTARSWERWVERYRERGLKVLTPTYPGFEIEVEGLRENPEVIENVTVPDTLDHLARVVQRISPAPIIMGHSFGGALTQVLVNRGLGAAGVVIDSFPTEGVRAMSRSEVKALVPTLRNPADRHRAVALTPEEFHYGFTNSLPEDESRAVWDRYHVPAPAAWVLDYGVFANFTPGHQDTWVDYSADRAPLLFIAGGADHMVPPAVNRSNAKHYRRSPAVTDYQEFAGRDHWTCGGPGWEAVADCALQWALDHATQPERRTVIER